MPLPASERGARAGDDGSTWVLEDVSRARVPLQPSEPKAQQEVERHRRAAPGQDYNLSFVFRASRVYREPYRSRHRQLPRPAPSYYRPFLETPVRLTSYSLPERSSLPLVSRLSQDQPSQAVTPA
jgi:hypothetical protein